VPVSSELLSALVSFVITVLILSYLFGDNPLFRATVYIFVGVSAGYVTAVAWNQVILPQLLQPIVSGTVFSNAWQAALLFVPLIGSGLLLVKASPRLSRLGQLPMAFLVGVGAAVTIGGAVLGTLLPQINATFGGFDINLAVSRGINPAFMILNGALILLGVVGTLAYFHFGARQSADGSVKRNFLVNILTGVGRIYIAITFGVLFAGVYMAALTALIERMDSLRNFIILITQSL
jgi:hypothetical protein